MKKMTKRAMTMMAAVMAVGIMVITSTTVMANDFRGPGGCPGRGLGSQMGGMMWDEDGNFLTREAFEERLDGWIDAGLFRSQDRDFMLERFDWCSSNGGGATGVRGACGGFGSGRNASRWS